MLILFLFQSSNLTFFNKLLIFEFYCFFSCDFILIRFWLRSWSFWFIWLSHLIRLANFFISISLLSALRALGFDVNDYYFVFLGRNWFDWDAGREGGLVRLGVLYAGANSNDWSFSVSNYGLNLILLSELV